MGCHTRLLHGELSSIYFGRLRQDLEQRRFRMTDKTGVQAHIGLSIGRWHIRARLPFDRYYSVGWLHARMKMVTFSMRNLWDRGGALARGLCLDAQSHPLGG